MRDAHPRLCGNGEKAKAGRMFVGAAPDRTEGQAAASPKASPRQWGAKDRHRACGQVAGCNGMTRAGTADWTGNRDAELRKHDGRRAKESR